MSLNSARTHRRAISPPAVTRFHLRTAAAAEAVFSPPYVAARPDQALARSHGRIEFPEPAPRPRPRPEPAATAAFEPVSTEPLPTPPPAAPQPEPQVAEPAPKARLEPQSERAEPEAAFSETETVPAAAVTEERTAAAETGPPETPASTHATPADVPAPEGPRVAPLPPPPVDQAPSQPAEPGAVPEDASATWREVIASIDIDEPPASTPDAASSIDRAHQLDAASSLDRAHLLDAEASIEAEEQRDAGDAARESIGWEFETMTTRAYAERHRSEEDIEDRVPTDEPPRASDEEDLEDLEELMAGDSGRRSDFPLDAFIVPGGAHHLPTGYEAQVAHLIAEHLDELAAQLRRDGLSALGGTHAVDELSRVLAAIVAGYIARGE